MKPENRKDLYVKLLNDIYELINIYQEQEKELYDLAFEYEYALAGMREQRPK